jgi:hypothetical protein
MITAHMDGRRLVLSVETAADEEPIEPFVVHPLGGQEGRNMSLRYALAQGGGPVGDLENDLLRAFGEANTERADNDLRTEEGELLVTAAYFWQMVGGIAAVNALLEPAQDGSQGGADARGKAIEVFQLRMVPYLSQTRHRLESARLTAEASIRDTSIRDGSKNSDGEPSSSPDGQQPQKPPSNPTLNPEPSPVTSD